MRSRPQWLLWKLTPPKAPGAKQGKLPYYVNGEPRGWPQGQPRDERGQIARDEQGRVQPTPEHPNVAQGHELDRAALVSFAQAVEVFKRKPAYAGIGFAFLPGDGLIGVDIDGAIDPATGEMSQLCQDVMALCPSFTEVSVSGTGIHVILAGEVDGFKDDPIGLEVYCGRQFFTCSGVVCSEVREVAPADTEALQTMREWVEQSKAQQLAEKDAARAAAALPPAPRPAPPAGQASGPASGKTDFRAVNDAALRHLGAWVTTLLPAARPYRNDEGGEGYRVTSKDLGRALQEDLAIMPKGINDFGTEEKLTAVDLVMRERGCPAREALHWLAPLVGVTLTPPKRQNGAGGAGAGGRPEPQPEGEARRDDPAGPAVADDVEAGQGAAENADSPPRKGGGRGGKGKKDKVVDPLKLDTLFKDYAYQYGSDIAWCVSRLKPVKIANLRHTFGGDAVRVWMAHDERRMVEEEHVVFEPGAELGPDYINLYAGMPLEPLKGDVAPMLELLRWLCATSEAPGMEANDIADWVLRWCGLLVQRPGVKMKSALVFHGPHGTGKNLFFDVLRDLFGDYGVMVGQTEIEDKYNTWLSGKMLIIGDEVVSSGEMFHAKNRLKWIITQTTKIPIRAMHMDTRWESNHANLIFLSNEVMPLALEEGDRRFLVVYTPNKERGDLYARVREFLDNDGARKWLHHLQTIPLDDFDPGDVPPLTRAKQDLIELGYRASERFVHEWLGGFVDLPMVACSSEQLYRVYRLWCDRSGERFADNRSKFTSTVKAFAAKQVELDGEGKERAPPLTLRDFTGPHPDYPNDPSRRKSWRIWLPRGCGPKDDEVGRGLAWDTQGHWAASVVKDFAKHMRAFSGRHEEPDDES
ncbi:MAG: hypothetical protein EOP35_05170 [Rubrivivax sp.]|nr:MAG: hypothetical protein EOP35_05170 [Rubrivivax sp.]